MLLGVDTWSEFSFLPVDAFLTKIRQLDDLNLIEFKSNSTIGTVNKSRLGKMICLPQLSPCRDRKNPFAISPEPQAAIGFIRRFDGREIE